MDEQERDTRTRLRAALRQKLTSLHQSGVQQLRKPPPPRKTPGDALSSEHRSPAQQVPQTPHPPPAEPPRPRVRTDGDQPAPRKELFPVDVAASAQAEGDRLVLLDQLRQEVAGCTRCTELVQNRTQTVFGAGDPRTRLCFLGEAPGADEDRRGVPFVGKAGQLLDRIIAACSLEREQVYILNVLKCRPPGNRTPLPDEVANCRRFFERQLEILAPEFICCLGAVAAQSLLQTTQSLGRLRGRFHAFRNSKVLVTYHPAYLLRSPNMKRAAWDDMKLLMREMGIELPK